MKKLFFVLAILVLGSGCAMRKNLVTPFTDLSNQPVINDGDKFCQHDASNKYSEAPAQVTSGMNGADAWAEGGGCVLRPIREVWAVFNNVTATKWEAADRMAFQRTVNPKEGFTHLYAITYYKGTIIGDINWTIDWYHSVTKGTYQKPLQVTINYQRVSGTSNIPVWQGGVVLNEITDKVTSIAIRNEFRARQSSSDNEQSSRDGLNELIDDSRKVAPDWDKLDITKVDQ